MLNQQETHRRRIVIIGGGITGLAAAHRLLELANQTDPQIEVLLLEASSRLGGVLKTDHRDGFLIEAGADSFISEKPEAIELAKRIGLDSHLIETNKEHRRSFVVRNGRLRLVPEGFHLLAPSRLWPFITSDIFSWSGKARMALDLFIPRRAIANGGDDESLAQFVRRRLGREALARMAQPMIGGIYTADPEKLSLRATLPRLLEMEREHGSLILAMWKQGRSLRGRSPTRGPQRGSPAGVEAVREGSGPRRDSREDHGTLPKSGVSGARYSLFLSFDGGMQLLADRLSSRLPAGAVQLNTQARSLLFHAEAKQWEIRLSDDRSIRAGAICLAVPAFAAAALLRNTDVELSRALDQIEFASTATINLAYRRADIPHPLDGFGFVVPFIEHRSILACTFSSVKFAGRAPSNHVLLRAFAGGALQPEMFELDEDEMISRVRADLRDLLGIEQPPLFAVVEKWRRSMPQYNVGHLELVSHIQDFLKMLPGLQLDGNSYGGVGVPDCIRSGETAASELFQSAVSGPS
jgi:oxygen-dependent protoporphyrinogen oxidase